MVEQLGVAALSKSQVSETAAYLDAQVEALAESAQDAGPYTFVWLDALTIKVLPPCSTVSTSGNEPETALRSPC